MKPFILFSVFDSQPKIEILGCDIEHLVSYVALLSHSSDPLLLSLFLLCKELVDNTYQKEYTNDLK
jgi:hypothetical protein